jgi:hypothetical protein
LVIVGEVSGVTTSRTGVGINTGRMGVKIGRGLTMKDAARGGLDETDINDAVCG